jgi:hypothetical protein
MDVARFEQVADHDFSAGGPQGGSPVVVTADHGADGKTAIEEQAGDGSPDRPKLASRAGYEDRSDIWCIHR